MSVTHMATLPDQIAEVRREIEMRRRTYLRMIDQGRMTKDDATTKTSVMVAVLHTLERAREEANNRNNGAHHELSGGEARESA
jgi:hypothetical protein